MERTIFRDAMGNSPMIRILETFIEGRGIDYSLSDIARISNVSWTTLHRVWPALVEHKIVKHTRRIGKAKMFILDEDTPTVQRLISLFDTLLFEANKEHLAIKTEIFK